MVQQVGVRGRLNQKPAVGCLIALVVIKTDSEY
jgi:hypothetical protein